MANRFHDGDLTTGLNDGTTWANAWQTMADVAANAATGDRVYWQGTETRGSHLDLTFVNGTPANPIRLLGVKGGTTAEPPTQSDLIPGFRTGNAIVAYDQTGANAPPKLTGGAGGWRVNIKKVDGLYIYGAIWEDTWITNYATNTPGDDINVIWEECRTGLDRTDQSINYGRDIFLSVNKHKFINCSWQHDTGGCGLDAVSIEVIGGKISNAFKVGHFDCSISAQLKMTGVDLTALGTNAMFNLAGCHGLIVDLVNCKVASGFVLNTGTLPGPGTEARTVGLSSATGITTSEQGFKYVSWGGTVIDETTVVRASGASDGAAGAFSRKITLNASETIEEFWPFKAPLLMGWIKGDGSTTQTITVFIHNTTADLKVDDAALRLFYPSGAGDALHEHINTVANLLTVTPADITDDSSLWNGSANFSQKFVVTLDGSPNPIPDYEGPIYGWIEYYKASGPILYYDPKIYIT